MKTSATALAALGTAFFSTLSTAQNLSLGADNFYRSDNVTLWPITFQTLYDTTITANLFLASDFDRTANHSAVIVGHPMGAVKEQGANLYAQKIAEQGFVTIALDLPFWGSSEGSPRQSVSTDFYADAFSAAVDYLGMQPYINRSRIGALGICGSGGFVVSAAKVDSRISAVATSTMYNMGTLNRHGLRNSTSLTARKSAIETSALQRWALLEGGPTRYTDGAPFSLTPNSSAVDREFYDFYRTSRGEVTPPSAMPNITSDRTLASNTKFVNFYPFEDIESISPRPMLFVHGDRAHSREFSEDAYARAAEPKELVWVPGAGHVDLYDRVDVIPWAKFVGFFRESFGM